MLLFLQIFLKTDIFIIFQGYCVLFTFGVYSPFLHPITEKHLCFCSESHSSLKQEYEGSPVNTMFMAVIIPWEYKLFWNVRKDSSGWLHSHHLLQPWGHHDFLSLHPQVSNTEWRYQKTIIIQIRDLHCLLGLVSFLLFWFFPRGSFPKPKLKLFFWDQILPNRYRNPQKIGKSLKTKKFWNRNVNLWGVPLNSAKEQVF